MSVQWTYPNIPLLVHVRTVSLFSLLKRPVTYKGALHPCKETIVSSPLHLSYYSPTLAFPDTEQEVHSYVPAVFLQTPPDSKLYDTFSESERL